MNNETVLRRQFDLAQACEDVRAFNRDIWFAASDSLVATQFSPYEVLSGVKASVGILTVDRLWATQLYRERGGIDRMLRLYQENVGIYRGCLERLRLTSLEADPRVVYELAAILLRTLLEPGDAKRRPYSFATKLFHWHAPEHLPIVGSRARRAINRLQKACGKSCGIVLSGTENLYGKTYVEEYRRWVDFYSELIGTLALEDRQRIMNADQESLPRPFRKRNSLIRVLDKVFYRRGSPQETTR